jgi:hypothetical protein
MILKLLLQIILASSISLAWTSHDKDLYNKRHFIELAHLLVMQKSASLAKLILKQELDLDGCRKMHRGTGGVEGLLECVRFINRENELKLKSPGRSTLISDINLLCGRYVSQQDKLLKILEGKIFNQKNWIKCSEFTWQQVYLTVYANFDADPTGSLGILRLAQASLGNDRNGPDFVFPLSSIWISKTILTPAGATGLRNC